MKVEPAWGVLIATINVHLPPLLPATRRCVVVGNAAAFLRTAWVGV